MRDNFTTRQHFDNQRLQLRHAWINAVVIVLGLKIPWEAQRARLLGFRVHPPEHHGNNSRTFSERLEPGGFRVVANAQPWVRQLAEVLVACEQFEAYSNQRRGRDYYVRRREDLSEAFAYLHTLQREGIISRPVVRALRELAAEGAFDAVLAHARGRALTARERAYLRRTDEE